MLVTLKILINILAVKIIIVNNKHNSNKIQIKKTPKNSLLNNQFWGIVTKLINLNTAKIRPM